MPLAAEQIDVARVGKTLEVETRIVKTLVHNRKIHAAVGESVHAVFRKNPDVEAQVRRFFQNPVVDHLLHRKTEFVVDADLETTFRLRRNEAQILLFNATQTADNGFKCFRQSLGPLRRNKTGGRTDKQIVVKHRSQIAQSSADGGVCEPQLAARNGCAPVPVDRQKNLDVVVTELIDVHGFLPLLNRFYWREPSRLSVSLDSDQFEKNCN